MDQQIGQLFSIGISGPELTPEEADFITKNNIGGVTLFGRNLESPKQIHKLCSDLNNLTPRMPYKAPLFIGIDMEGGRVHRLKAPFTQWPALRKVGDLDSTSMAFRFANAMGMELKAVGINLDFAPCVDILTNPKNEIIGDRALGTDPEHVAKMASAIVRGYIKSGLLPCAKHFPGHGNTLLDSHEELPVEDVDLETLLNRELIPFKKAFRARLDMVMTAHIQFNALDSSAPVTLSKKILTELVRGEMRFRNVIISDDLDMKALRNSYSREEIPVKALQAGCDILLYCNEPESPIIGLHEVKRALQEGQLDKHSLQESYTRVMELKKRKLSTIEIPPFSEAAKIIGHPDHLRVAKAIADGQILEDMKAT